MQASTNDTPVSGSLQEALFSRIVGVMAQKKQIQAISFIALLALMIVLMGKVLLPYMTVLLWSAVMYILISPLHSRILARFNKKSRLYEFWRHILAGLFALGTVLVLTGIAIFLGFKLIGQVKIFLEEIKLFVLQNPHFFRNEGIGLQISKLVKDLSLGSIDLSTLNVKAEILSFLSKYSNRIASFTGGVIRNLSNLVISLFFICFALYFFFLDARYLANVLVNAVPIDQKNTKHLLSKFRDVTKNLFMGFFLVAFYQAIVAFIIFSIFRIQGSLLFAVLILFSSFVPMIGTGLVWGPIGISLIFSRSFATATVFGLLCAFFISFLDNFLRPFFLKDRIKIHPLLIFFSIIGGLKVFGFNGVLLGPLIIILFFTILDIALEEDVISLTSETIK